LSAQTSATKADTYSKNQVGVGQLQCSGTLTQFAAQSCEGKGEATNTDKNITCQGSP
jgi:hypothetical protein